jgi:DNA-binding NtrC family response regulator
LGGLIDIQLDLRVVAATNRNLREAVKEGAFRQDLYYRLNVIQITIPPLRDRTGDIWPLARYFIEHYNRRFKRRIEGLSPDAARLLLSYDWPGNVRELRNAIERGMILEESALITPTSLPISVHVLAGTFRSEFRQAQKTAPNGLHSKTASAFWWPARWSKPAATRLRRLGYWESHATRSDIGRENSASHKERQILHHKVQPLHRSSARGPRIGRYRGQTEGVP